MSSATAAKLMNRTIVWYSHACMLLRPGDTTFLPQLERVRRAGVNVISLNVSYDLHDPREAVPVLVQSRANAKRVVS